MRAGHRYVRKSRARYERHFLLTIIWYSAIIGVIALLGSLWYSRSISRPLLKLADDLGRVQRLELDHGEEIRSSIKEVVIMREAIYRMKNGLRSFRKYVPPTLSPTSWNLARKPG
jgi:nitrogen fixation/metabolism regulation signal transduction histidine kinase